VDAILTYGNRPPHVFNHSPRQPGLTCIEHRVPGGATWDGERLGHSEPVVVDKSMPWMGPFAWTAYLLHRAAVPSRNWPKATINVAWGNAPGNRSHSTRLAEGQTHLRHGLPCVNMAFGQTPRCAPIPGATVRTDLRPDDSYPGTAPLVQGRQPDTGFAVRSKPLIRSGSPVEQMSKPAPEPFLRAFHHARCNPCHMPGREGQSACAR